MADSSPAFDGNHKNSSNILISENEPTAQGCSKQISFQNFGRHEGEVDDQDRNNKQMPQTISVANLPKTHINTIELKIDTIDFYDNAKVE